MIVNECFETPGTRRVRGIDRKLGLQLHMTGVNDYPKLVVDRQGQRFVFVGSNKIAYSAE